jgi:hypothetical protein
MILHSGVCILTRWRRAILLQCETTCKRRDSRKSVSHAMASTGLLVFAKNTVSQLLARLCGVLLDVGGSCAAYEKQAHDVCACVCFCLQV